MNYKKSAEVIVLALGEEGLNLITKELNPFYVCGFVDGEGCFTVYVHKHKTKKLGYDARMSFEIELRFDDEIILQRIKSILGCGHITHLNYDKYGWVPHVKYKVSSIKDIGAHIIHFFSKNKLQAKKRQSFLLFCNAYQIFEFGGNLTLEGINDLRLISKEMKMLSKRSN